MKARGEWERKKEQVKYYRCVMYSPCREKTNEIMRLNLFAKYIYLEGCMHVECSILHSSVQYCSLYSASFLRIWTPYSPYHFFDETKMIIWPFNNTNLVNIFQVDDEIHTIYLKIYLAVQCVWENVWYVHVLEIFAHRFFLSPSLLKCRFWFR